MWREDGYDEGGERGAVPTDEEAGLAGPGHAHAGTQPIPERPVASSGANAGSATLSLQSPMSSVSAGESTGGKVSFHQQPQQPQPPPPRNDSCSSLACTSDADAEGADARFGAGRGHASASSFHTTQAAADGEGQGESGITVVEDVRALGHVVENHIVVLLPKAMDKIQYLLRPLRAQFLRGTPFCKSVVILTESSVEQLERQCRSLEVRTDETQVEWTLDTVA